MSPPGRRRRPTWSVEKTDIGDEVTGLETSERGTNLASEAVAKLGVRKEDDVGKAEIAVEKEE